MSHPVVLLVAHDRAGRGHVMHVYPRDGWAVELTCLFSFLLPSCSELGLAVDSQPRRGLWAFEGAVALESGRPSWSGAWIPLAEALRRNLVLWEHIAGGSC